MEGEEARRRSAAYHEAGHAVASLMRGGSALISVTLDESVHGAGLTVHRSKPPDGAFIAWAGPWAEARHRWGDQDVDSLDDQGCSLADYEVAALMTQPQDAELTHGTSAQTEDVWRSELTRAWPAIEEVAALLLADAIVTDPQVRDALERALERALKGGRTS